MTVIRKISKIGILCLLGVSIFLLLVPAAVPADEDVRLYARHDDLIGSKPMYFALTGNGNLIGWGGKSVRSFRSTRDGFGSPYVMRQVVANNAKDFACGAYNGMYIDDENSLWGWGVDEGLLFTDKRKSSGAAVRIMENVQSIAVGQYHAAAIKTDGSLWTWGRNLDGQLGIGTIGVKDGNIIDEGTYYEPQKVMENAKSVYILEDNITFAVAGNDDLYVWGNGAICSPYKIAEDIQSVNLAAITKGGTIFQCLTTAGDIFLFDLYAEDFEAQFDEPALYKAESICRFAVMKEDGSLWKWEISEGESQLVEVEKEVVYAAAADFYLTDAGKLFVNSTASITPKPIATVVPYLRNTMILLFGLLLITRQRSKEPT